MWPDELDKILEANGLTPEQRRAMIEMLMASTQQPPLTGTYVSPDMAAMDPDWLGVGEDLLGYQNDVVDYGRDVNTLLSDQMSGAMAGLGGYGGGQIGLDAFMPTVEREYVDGPENSRYAQYLQADPTSLEGWAAGLINQSGAMSMLGDAQAILTDMTATGGANLTPEQQRIGQQLQQFQYQDPVTGDSRTDLDSLRAWALDLEKEKYAATPAGASFDPQTGQWYTETTTPSPADEWYRERGLPAPYLQYELGDFSPEAQDYKDLEGLLGQRNAQRQGNGYYDDLINEATSQRALTQRFLAMQNMPQQAPAAQQPAQQPVRLEMPEISQPATDLGMTMPQQPGPDAHPGEWAEYNQQVALLAGPGNIGMPAINGRPQDGTSPTLGTSATQQAKQAQMSPPPVETSASPWDIMQLARDAISQSVGPVADRIQGRRTGQGMLNNRREAVSRAYRQQGRDDLELFRAQQQALGRRFLQRNAATGNISDFMSRGDDGNYVLNQFEPDVGVAQGLVNYAAAQAQGRTPLQDALRQRAMATYMMGG